MAADGDASRTARGPAGAFRHTPVRELLRSAATWAPYARLMEVVRDFPLFGLGLVALPSELIPLHIFEERYKAMMARCLEESSEFGIVWEGEDGMHDVGCACEIVDVLERFDDGRL